MQPGPDVGRNMAMLRSSDWQPHIVGIHYDFTCLKVIQNAF